MLVEITTEILRIKAAFGIPLPSLCLIWSTRKTVGPSLDETSPTLRPGPSSDESPPSTNHGPDVDQRLGKDFENSPKNKCGKLSVFTDRERGIKIFLSR